MSSHASIPHPVLTALRCLLSELRLSLGIWIGRGMHPISLAAANDRLNLGCGKDLRAGWINVDIAPPRVEGFQVIPADLRRPLPFSDACVTEIYSSHFLEHLDLPCAMAFLSECRRVLKPSGTIRLCLPDLHAIAKAWIDDDLEYLEDLAPHLTLAGWSKETATPTDHVDYAFHQNGEHRIITDSRRCNAMLKAAGFHDIHQTAYDRALDPDDQLREKYSFILVASR